MGNSKIQSRKTDTSTSGTLPAFWKRNESLIHALEQSNMPPRSRLIFKEISSENVNGHTITNYDLINVYDNRKNFLAISAELSDNGSIVKEEILAGNKTSNAKRTVIDGTKITNKAQIDWIKNMSNSDTCQLFRT